MNVFLDIYWGPKDGSALKHKSIVIYNGTKKNIKFCRTAHFKNYL